MGMRTGAQRSRKEKAADAAIEVIADGGLRGLTHRAVDTRAELPAGSTSSCFRTRSALLRGVLDRLVEWQEAMLARYPVTGWRNDTPEERAKVVDMLTDLLEYWLGDGRSHGQARLELYLDAVRRPELRPYLEQASGRFLERTRAGLEEGGLHDPAGRARIILAHLDGVLFDALTRPFFGRADRAYLRTAVDATLAGVGV
jgi:DNA-binding transcriptional regulator YbjK